MRYGRIDCNGFPRERAQDFPESRMGLRNVLAWCRDVFNFSERECVAIIGKLIHDDVLGNETTFYGSALHLILLQFSWICNYNKQA